eukprot:1743-Heterococcus_DN1.PRE.2
MPFAKTIPGYRPKDEGLLSRDAGLVVNHALFPALLVSFAEYKATALAPSPAERAALPSDKQLKRVVEVSCCACTAATCRAALHSCKAQNLQNSARAAR